MTALQEILQKDIYRVDCLSGHVYGKHQHPLGSRTAQGYLATTFKHKGNRLTYKIHQIIAFAGGLDITEPLTVNHIDGNKLNNSLSNLEAITNAENVKHALKLGLNKGIPVRYGADRPNSKLTDQMVRNIRKEYAEGNVTVRKLSDKFGVSHSVIVRVIQRKAWRHID